MITLIKWLIVMIGMYIQEKQLKTGENIMSKVYENQFQGESWGVRLSKALPPYPSDLALP